MPSANLLTVEEIGKIKASGGGAILSKVDFLKAKLKDGAGSSKDVDAYNALAARCRSLIGEHEEEAGHVYDPEVERKIAERIESRLTELSASPEITDEEFVVQARAICRQEERMISGKHAFMRYASKLKVKGLPITMFSSFLHDTVTLVANEAEARKMPLDGRTVYTIDEVLGILKADTSNDDWSKLHCMKKEFNGQLDFSFNNGGRN